MRSIFFLLLFLPALTSSLSTPPPNISRRNLFKTIPFAIVSVPLTSSAGGGDASINAAWTAQAIETNKRLASSGFKIDTPEEENAKLSSGLASFSYDDFSSSKQKKR